MSENTNLDRIMGRAQPEPPADILDGSKLRGVYAATLWVTGCLLLALVLATWLTGGSDPIGLHAHGIALNLTDIPYLWHGTLLTGYELFWLGGMSIVALFSTLQNRQTPMQLFGLGVLMAMTVSFGWLLMRGGSAVNFGIANSGLAFALAATAVVYCARLIVGLGNFTRGFWMWLFRLGKNLGLSGFCLITALFPAIYWTEPNLVPAGLTDPLLIVASRTDPIMIMAGLLTGVWLILQPNRDNAA